MPISQNNNPKQYSLLIKVTIGFLDILLMACAFILAYWLRFPQNYWPQLPRYFWLFYVSAPITTVIMLRYGVLTGFRYQRLQAILLQMLQAFLLSGIACSAVMYLIHVTHYSRLLFTYYFLLAGVFVLLEKTVIKTAYDAYLRRGGMNIKIVLIGWGNKLDEIRERIEQNTSWGISIVDIFDTRELSPDKIAQIVKSKVIDEVYISMPRDRQYQHHVDDLLQRLEHYGVPIKIALNHNDVCQYYSQQPCKMAAYDGMLLAPYNLDPDQLIIKRVMDIAGSMIGLLITAVLFVPLAIAIKLDSRGPVFFDQLRVGKGGRRFCLYKFRSMCADAEQRKQELAELNIHDGPIFKLEQDPRITRVGRFIRKYSLDEFPQFWNVLKGEMSLVGTRPPTVDEVDCYEEKYLRRISMKPGITGLWQVSGRNRITDFDKIVKLDLAYIKSWNPWLDICIIFKTFFVAFFPGKNQGM